MRVFVLVALICVSACSWFGSRKRPLPPDPPEIVVTGAPIGSLLFVDGAQTGPPAAHNDQSQVLNVAAGTHIVEIHMGDTVVYRENTYVGAGDRRVVIVLSGSSR